MARKDQPYLPLYVQDIMTDEKLIECSASTHGVYMRLMCILHKQDDYGKILLKQKYKQNESKVKNFASMIARQMPFSLLEIENALSELYNEDVIQIDGDYLFQKRMVNDGELSDKRASAGSRGGKKATSKKKFAQAKSKAKGVANAEIEIDIENESENDIKTDNEDKGGAGGILIDYLNLALGDGNFQKRGQSLKLANARLQEYGEKMMRDVIDLKVSQWETDEKMSKYLRPDTLFRPTKCEGYVQEVKNRNSGKIKSTNGSSKKAGLEKLDAILASRKASS